MRVRNSLRIVSIKPAERSFCYVVILAAFFLGGSFAGVQFFEYSVENSQIDIAGYLLDFCEIARSVPTEGSIFRTISSFFFYPAVVFLSGLSPLGIILIPVFAFSFGFGTIFTVQCFLSAFSRVGIVPVFALLSVRLTVTLVCFLCLAVEALPQSWRIAQVTIRSGKHSESVCHGRRLAVLALLCSIVLALGVCWERFLTPVLFRLALEKIF